MFLRNHAPDIVAIDLFVVPTIGFRLLYRLAIIRLARRYIVSVNITDRPAAEWFARQLTDAFPWQEVPRYLIRDLDGAYDPRFLNRLRTMRVRDHPASLAMAERFR